MHRRVGRFRQYLAISVHSLRERRRRFPHPLRDSVIPSGETVLLSGDDYRTILRQFVRQSLEHIAGLRWYVFNVLLDNVPTRQRTKCEHRRCSLPFSSSEHKFLQCLYKRR